MNLEEGGKGSTVFRYCGETLPRAISHSVLGKSLPVDAGTPGKQISSIVGRRPHARTEIQTENTTDDHDVP